LYYSNSSQALDFVPSAADFAGISMLALILLSNLPLAFSECAECKEVDGTGPLAGFYELTNSEEPRCKDGCGYISSSGDPYCFETLGNDEYETRPCESSSCSADCAPPCSPCGTTCLTPREVGLFEECGSECQMVGLPCNGSCPSGTFICGEVCTDDSEQDQYRDCEGVCQTSQEPCLGECPSGLQPCQNGTVCLNALAQQCNGDCQAQSIPCNGACPDEMMLCDAGTDNAEHKFMCFAENDAEATALGFHYCKGACLPLWEPCDGACKPGWLQCGSGNNFTCVEDNGDQWKCGESCQPTYTACHGSCPHGHILMSNECALQESLCQDQQCAQDSDCQENAGCLLSGTVMACQCYLNFVASNATAAACPRTGVCTHALQIAQEGSLPPCYEQNNAKICPFSFAKIGDTVFDFVSSGGNGFGPNTYNGNTTSPMIFETVTTGVTCQLEMTFDCWQDWPTARDNRQAATLATVIVNATDVPGTQCDKHVSIITPLACPAMMPL